MDALKQYQPLLRNGRSSAEVARNAGEVKAWIEGCDNSRSDSNKTDDIVDHFQMGMGIKVQADFKNLDGGGFEVNRMLEERGGKPMASRVRVENGQVSGFEVQEFPDGSKRGYHFTGQADSSAPISTTLMADQEAAHSWTSVWISTAHI
jgi:hypothetical protein